MIQILLFHGTISKFQKSFVDNGILLTKAKPRVDFGAGFYTAANESFAKRTAYNHARKYNNISDNEKVFPLLLTLELDNDALNELRIRRFTQATPEWLRFVLYNRVNPKKKRVISGGKPFELCDVVTGPIADAGIVSLIYDINDDRVQWTKLSPQDVAPYHDGTDLQYSFHTAAAVSCLKIVKYDILELPKGDEAL